MWRAATRSCAVACKPPSATPADRLQTWLAGSRTARRGLTNAEVDALIDTLGARLTDAPPPQLTLWRVDPVGGPSTPVLCARQDPIRRDPRSFVVAGSGRRHTAIRRDRGAL